MKLKLLILSCLALASASCSTLTDMSSGGQRFVDGVYFNGKTAPKEPADYVPAYNSKARTKLTEPDYGAMVGVGVTVVAAPYAWYNWYWDPWYNPWYWDPWYGPWGPGWGPYYPWYRPWGPWGPYGPYRPWGPYYPGCYWSGYSGHSPVGGSRYVNPYHSGGAGSYSSYRRGGYSGSSPVGGINGVYHQQRGTNTGTVTGGGSYGGGTYHPDRGGYNGGSTTRSSPAGGYNGGGYNGGGYHGGGGGGYNGGGGGSFGGGGRGGGSYGGGGGRR